MRKYIETAKIQFKTQLVYRFDIITNIVFTISKILLAYILWGAIFGKHSVISGFTFNSMISYYIISSFISQLDKSGNMGYQIAEEIKNGRFSKYLVKPINILGYFTSQVTGTLAFFVSLNLVAAVIWIFVFNIDFVIIGDIKIIISALTLIIFGLFFMVQLNYFIGILAFKFIDIELFIMIKENLVDFFTGTLIPLALLPISIVKYMEILPFYYITYLPSMILLGKNTDEISRGIIILICWNFFFLILNKITFNRLKNKYEGVGI